MWRYVYEAAAVEDLRPVLSSMFGMRQRDMTRLTALHLLLSDETISLVTAVERLLPALPSVARMERQELQGAVVGQVDWAATVQRRYAAWDPTLFVCARPERRYDTMLARAVREALQHLEAACRAASLRPTGTLGRVAWERLVWAGETLRHRKLRDVRTVSLSERDLEAVRSRTLGRPVADFIRLYRDLFHDRSQETIAELVSRRVLAPRETSTLLELLAGFGLAEALERRGFTRLPPERLLGARTPIARLRSADREARIYWQTSLWSIGATARSSGRLAEVVRAARLPHRDLRPDLLVDIESTTDRRIFIGEVKYTERSPSRAESRGILDALAYLKDADEYYVDKSWRPHAFVVAWGSEARPAADLVSVTDLKRVDDLAALLTAGAA
ncbi:hypothetical protein JOD57_000054 [Geodermatophilus bullaregiensis]|uniref:hypothetical protein n=1 Tax=Geodermatophilus bullaregiensis TaxID=1564160 RepID=UPI0019597FDE|nr:hypothetical protein [Geodermatophilus bullaregiensis]MBM7804217.1 hypothetical protein [Geodermatophilus bullaregiensis]